MRVTILEGAGISGVVPALSLWIVLRVGLQGGIWHIVKNQRAIVHASVNPLIAGTGERTGQTIRLTVVQDEAGIDAGHIDLCTRDIVPGGAFAGMVELTTDPLCGVVLDILVVAGEFPLPIVLAKKVAFRR